MNQRLLRLALLACIHFLFLFQLSAQCLMRPVSLQQRASESAHVVLGKLVSQEAYWDAEYKNIYTLSIVEVEAWLKGYRPQQYVGVISMGGFVGDRGQITYPSLELEPFNEYVLFLNPDNHEIDNRAVRLTQPDLLQAETFACTQGAITKQAGVFHDLLAEKAQSEESLFQKLRSLTGEMPKTPGGQTFVPRQGDTYPLYEWAQAEQRHMPITSFTPSPTNAGTIVATDFVTITGSGFGAAAGTVFYTNADDGGATFTSSGVASDNVSWADGSIQNKPARRAGTGPINVNGAMTSGSNLTVRYSHIEINSTFSSFASSTRQRYYLVNKNAAGGYTFTYNTAFNGNAAAVASFERAVATWRCATFVNFNVNKSSTSGLTAIANDGVNLVLFDATLPVGVLGRATSRFLGTGGGPCTLANTVWYTDEIDVQFFPDPPSAGFPWNYGPAAPGFSTYDFESVAVHELGHAHGLGHVISAGAVMHFALSNGSAPRTPNANELAGGNAKMAYSVLPLCTTPGGVTGPMIALNSSNCTLPVSLLSFTGTARPDVGNVLDWTVGSESQNLGWDVEHSLDGHDFVKIGAVQGRGTATTEASYSFVDGNPVPGMLNYYRLLQRDQDGREAYTETVTIANADGNHIEVLPTRVRDHVRIVGETSLAGTQFVLVDLRGVELQRVALPVGAVDVDLDMTALASGVYLFKVGSAQGLLRAGKLVKE